MCATDAIERRAGEKVKVLKKRKPEAGRAAFMGFIFSIDARSLRIGHAASACGKRNRKRPAGLGFEGGLGQPIGRREKQAGVAAGVACWRGEPSHTGSVTKNIPRWDIHGAWATITQPPGHPASQTPPSVGLMQPCSAPGPHERAGIGGNRIVNHSNQRRWNMARQQLHGDDSDACGTAAALGRAGRLLHAVKLAPSHGSALSSGGEEREAWCWPWAATGPDKARLARTKPEATMEHRSASTSEFVPFRDTQHTIFVHIKSRCNFLADICAPAGPTALCRLSRIRRVRNLRLRALGVQV
jgi:hypothetical protein